MYKTACFSYNVKHGNGSEWALSTPFGMINYWCKNSFSYRQQKRQIEGLCEYIGWFEKDDKSGMSICGLFLTFRLVATQRRWTSTKKPSGERLWSSLIYYYHFSDCLKNSGCGEIELAVREARELEYTQFLPFFDCTNIRGKWTLEWKMNWKFIVSVWICRFPLAAPHHRRCLRQGSYKRMATSR